jgi:hypothetical protein
MHVMANNSGILHDSHQSPAQSKGSNSDIDPFSLLLSMDVKAINNSLDRLPLFFWAHNDLHTIVYNNLLARENFGDCTGQQCYECLMGEKKVCRCCMTAKILKYNEPEVCRGCQRGDGGPTFDTFHSPVIMKDGSKYVLKFSVDRNSKGNISGKRKDTIKTKSLPVPAFRSMCASCKRIKDPIKEWITVERYLRDHFDIIISHGICRECMGKLYPSLKF